MGEWTLSTAAERGNNSLCHSYRVLVARIYIQLIIFFFWSGRASHTLESLKMLNKQLEKNSCHWSQRTGCALCCFLAHHQMTVVGQNGEKMTTFTVFMLKASPSALASSMWHDTETPPIGRTSKVQGSERRWLGKEWMQEGQWWGKSKKGPEWHWANIMIPE